MLSHQSGVCQMAIVLITIAAIIIFVFLQNQRNDRNKKAVAARNDADAKKQRDGLNAQDDFFSSERADWPFQTPARSEGQAMLMATSNVSRLRLQFHDRVPGFFLGRSVEVETCALRSVNTVETFRTERVSKTEHVPV